AFSPDGKRVLSGSLDRTARLWDAATGEPKGSRPSGAEVTSVAFAADGRAAAVADERGGVVTDATLEKELWRWAAPGRGARVAFSPDGRLLATANADGTVYLIKWK